MERETRGATAAVKGTTGETDGKIREIEVAGEIIGTIAKAGTHVDGLMSAGEIRTGEITAGILITEIEHRNLRQLKKWTGRTSSEMAEALICRAHRAGRTPHHETWREN